MDYTVQRLRVPTIPDFTDSDTTPEIEPYLIKTVPGIKPHLINTGSIRVGEMEYRLFTPDAMLCSRRTIIVKYKINYYANY